jgi:hypothetical protein
MKNGKRPKTKTEHNPHCFLVVVSGGYLNIYIYIKKKQLNLSMKDGEKEKKRKSNNNRTKSLLLSQ